MIVDEIYEETYLDNKQLDKILNNIAEELHKNIAKLNINYDVLITSDDVNKVKPDQEPILKALNMLKVMPEETIGIGDTIYDRESYKKAGLENIFILNCNDLNCFESICDVIDVIKKKYF